MRDGANPSKINSELPEFMRHRVIVPVYIPNTDGYFKHGLEILKLCLESLRLTAAGKASITLVSNDSCDEVVRELKRHYDAGWIDQLLLNQRNWGRVDTMMSVARMAFEDLITVSDSDVLFKPGWLKALENIFHTFPECGFASTTPNPTFTWYCTSATILGGFSRRELSFEKVVSDEDLDRFAHSIGRSDLFKPKHRESQMILRRNGQVACVGGGHFVCTLRREVVAGSPKEPSLKAYQGGAEQVWKDRPPDKMGYWRLATTKSYTYHLGNTPEAWMYEELEHIRHGQEQLRETEPAQANRELPEIRRSWAAYIPWNVRNSLVSRIGKYKSRDIAAPVALKSSQA